ncbi:phage tail protein [Nocardioides yefusunii]|uniref:Phage tail protein n=1 Tax=Nocardioides yefusunii TaxID=2500546 RepID=A0ABW1QSH9_9ACTN|nr:tail fiber protein [Nocardioides yefusunii]
MSNPHVGEIRLFAGNFEPQGWMFCAGQTLPTSTHQALFALLGTTYGGNGITTFALPDMRGRVPIHQGNGLGLSGRALGERGGQEGVALLEQHIPGHTHQSAVSAKTATSRSSVGNVRAALPDGKKAYSQSASKVDVGRSSSAGGWRVHENRQPYLGLHYIIAVSGVFPSSS